jgi:DnaK suppressor protein
MTPAQRKQWEKNLRTLERELLHQGPRKTEGTRSADGDAGSDEDAQPLAEMLQAIASNRNANQAQLVAKIRRALAKADTDEAGVCEECGEEIAWGRLRAIPFTERCVTCQAQKDGPRGLPTRRKLTDYQ